MKNRNSFKNIVKISLILLLGQLVFSCTKEKNSPALDLGLAYFPLKLHSVTIYSVDSTVYNDFNSTTTLYQFQLKDTITGTFIDLQGKSSYKIDRYKRTGTNPWIFQKVISKNIFNNRAEEFIDNKRYVRLVFPPQLQRSWNGNLYNDMDAWPYVINSIDQKLIIGTKTLDSTLNIEQYKEVNLIREDIYTETYAKHIGLVIKEVKAVDKDISSGRIKKGFAYKMQLYSYQ